MSATQSLDPGQSNFPPGYGIEHDDMVPRPFIPPPVYHCAESVLVLGCLENAFVYVFDQDDTKIGGGVCGRNGEALVTFDNGPLSNETALYASQTIDGFTSIVPTETTPVTSYPSDVIATPKFLSPVYECSQSFALKGLVPGATLQVEETTSASWRDDYPNYKRRYAYTTLSNSEVAQGEIGEEVRVRQIMCPDEPIATSTDGVRLIEAEPSNIPAPEPLDFDGTSAFANVESMQLGATNVLPGSKVSFLYGNAPTLYEEYVSPYTTLRVRLPQTATLDPSWNIFATQKLCAQSPPSQAYFPATSDTGLTLAEPTIIEPVCAGSTWVEVISPGTGFTTVKQAGNILALSSARGRFRIPLPPSVTLADGDTIASDQILLNGATSTADTATVVDGGISFEMYGGQTFTNVQTNEVYEDAFERQESQGPVFTYRDCCAGSLPLGDDSVTVDILRGSTRVAEVKLTKHQSGYFEGQWDWFHLIAAGEILPFPYVDYQARIVSPCTDEEIIIPFHVIAGSADPADVFPPGTRLELDDGTNTIGVSDPLSPEYFNVRPGADIKANMKGFDSFGVKTVSLVATGALSKNSSLTVPEQPPLPEELTRSFTTNELEPLELVFFTATSEDFNGNTSQVDITAVALPAAPVLEEFTPDPVYTFDTNEDINEINLIGKELAFPSTKTEVVFREVPGDPNEHIAPSFNVSSHELLRDVPLPASLVESEKIYVSVRVDGVESNLLEIKRADRKGPMTKLVSSGQPGFSTTPSTKTCSANANDPFAIHKVVVVPSNVNGQVNVEVYLNGDTNKKHILEQGLAAPGVLLDTTSCRTIATWGIAGGGNRLKIRHYHDSTMPNEKFYDNIADVLHFSTSKDGSVFGLVFIGNASTNAKGRLYDLRENDTIDQGDLGCTNSCNYSTAIEKGRVVKLSSSGTVELQGVVQ